MPILKRAKPIVVKSRKSSVAGFVRNEAKTHKFITTRRHPVYYMAITKCGSTFLKNLFYVLDHDELHPNPDYIHDHPQDLDWQLPLYLGEVIPDLAEKMATAKSRNATPYPISPHDIMSAELERRINDVYADDLVLYQHISRRWSVRRHPSAPAISKDPRINVLTTHSHAKNLNLIVMQKAGCTYVRNLTYMLDHGRAHPNPAQIAADQCLAHHSKTS